MTIFVDNPVIYFGGKKGQMYDKKTDTFDVRS